MTLTDPESIRLTESHSGKQNWNRWGPYLAERQWGTVREDYSPDGNAWEYLSYDAARSRAYRWGEDGIAGFSDDRQTRNAGIASYDVSGVWEDVDENRAHGRDERIGVQAFDESVEFTYRLLKAMSAR